MNNTNNNNDPVNAVESFIAEVNEDELRGNVQWADSSAKELITTVNTWIADCVSAGGDEKKPDELTIKMDNGAATITNTNKDNSWEAIGRFPESLKERFEADYAGRTFTARVFIDESGYAAYSWYVRDNADYNGAAPVLADYEQGSYDNWNYELNGKKIEGITEAGIAVGTAPKLFSK